MNISPVDGGSFFMLSISINTISYEITSSPCTVRYRAPRDDGVGIYCRKLKCYLTVV